MDDRPLVIPVTVSFDITVDREGVRVGGQPAAPQDDREVIAEFIEAIDPARLEAEALADADASGSLTGTMLAILARWARGR